MFIFHSSEEEEKGSKNEKTLEAKKVKKENFVLLSSFTKSTLYKCTQA